MVHQIIYTSAAKEGAALEDFREIARHSAQNNQTLDVTGILLFFESNIMQVIEGEQAIVETLFNRIKHDDRHSAVTLLVSRATEKREFQSWSMGFSEVGLDDANQLAFLLNRTNLLKALPDNPSKELDVLTRTYARVSGF